MKKLCCDEDDVELSTVAIRAFFEAMVMVAFTLTCKM
jgi:hypothetical protein